MLENKSHLLKIWFPIIFERNSFLYYALISLLLCFQFCETSHKASTIQAFAVHFWAGKLQYTMNPLAAKPSPAKDSTPSRHQISSFSSALFEFLGIQYSLISKNTVCLALVNIWQTKDFIQRSKKVFDKHRIGEIDY